MPGRPRVTAVPPGHTCAARKRHRHVDERVDRGRMIAHAVQNGGAVVAAQHRRDRGELQLGRDGAHRADRRVDQLDRQIDGCQEADAGETARDPRQQPPERAGGRTWWDDDDDFTESIVTLQLFDRPAAPSATPRPGRTQRAAI